MGALWYFRFRGFSNGCLCKYDVSLEAMTARGRISVFFSGGKRTGGDSGANQIKSPRQI